MKGVDREQPALTKVRMRSGSAARPSTFIFLVFYGEDDHEAIHNKREGIGDDDGIVFTQDAIINPRTKTSQQDEQH